MSIKPNGEIFSVYLYMLGLVSDLEPSRESTVKKDVVEFRGSELEV